MRRDFVTISVDATLQEAYRIMQLARLRHLLVERDGVLHGLLTYRDLQDEAIERLAKTAPPHHDVPLRSVAVGEAMLTSPYVIGPDASAREAASRMCNLHVGCLPVCEVAEDGPRLLGLITESDLLRAACEVW